MNLRHSCIGVTTQFQSLDILCSDADGRLLIMLGILHGAKIEKLEKEIDKTKNKIAEMQARLRDLEKQKTELENTDYVAIARSFHLTPQQLAEFLKSQQAAPSGDGPLQKQEDMNED